MGWNGNWFGDDEAVVEKTYRMRAFDETLEAIVFWNSNECDSDGSEYAGPGPLIDIVVQVVIGF